MKINGLLDDAMPIGNGIDQRGELFFRESKVLRRVSLEYSNYYRDLFRSGVIPTLISQGHLIETVPLNLQDDSFQLILEQPLVTPITYVHEWPKPMLISAAKACLNLHEALFEQGQCICDSHPWNILFDQGQPKWVDITSIQTFDGNVATSSLDQFETSFLRFLQLLESGFQETARHASSHAFHRFSLRPSFVGKSSNSPKRLLKRLVEVVQTSSKILVGSTYAEIQRTFRARRNDTSQGAMVHRVQKLRREIDKLDPSSQSATWTSYSQAGLDVIESSEVESKTPKQERLSNKKFLAIYEMLLAERKTSDSLLDLACNRGLYSLFAKLMGYEVTATDLDEGAIEDLYRESLLHKLPITIALNDFVVPLEASGMSFNPFPSFHQRMSADGVMCLALIHHLCLGPYLLSFRNLSKMLSAICQHFLILEFVPPEDGHLLDNYSKSSALEGYNAAALRKALEPEFLLEENRPSYPEGRELWLLRRRDARGSVTH